MNYSLLNSSACPRRYLHQYIERLAPLRRGVPELVGSAVHAALAVLYGENDWPVAQAADVGTQTILSYKKRCIELGVFLSPEDEEELDVQANIVASLVRGYGVKYAGDKIRWLVLAVEKKLEHQLSPMLAINGRLDLVVEDRESKELLIVDHKTAGQISPVYLARLAIDPQLPIYVDLWEQNGGGTVAKVLVNILRKPALRQRKGESHGEFVERVAQDAVEREEWYFTRKEIAQDKLSVTAVRARESLVYRAGQITQWGLDNSYPMDVSRCMDYGGCPYLPLCCKEPLAEKLFCKKNGDEEEKEKENVA